MRVNPHPYFSLHSVFLTTSLYEWQTSCVLLKLNMLLVNFTSALCESATRFKQLRWLLCCRSPTVQISQEAMLFCEDVDSFCEDVANTSTACNIFLIFPSALDLWLEISSSSSASNSSSTTLVVLLLVTRRQQEHPLSTDEHSAPDIKLPLELWQATVLFTKNIFVDYYWAW